MVPLLIALPSPALAARERRRAPSDCGRHYHNIRYHHRWSAQARPGFWNTLGWGVVSGLCLAPHRSSPMSSTGRMGLKARRVSAARAATRCSHIGACASRARSHTRTCRRLSLSMHDAGAIMLLFWRAWLP